MCATYMCAIYVCQLSMAFFLVDGSAATVVLTKDREIGNGQVSQR